MTRLHKLVAVVLMSMSLCTVVSAQGSTRSLVASPILTIDSDRLFEDSDFGRTIIEEIEQLGAELSAENRRIEDELTREEKELTELRPTITAEEFRALADAFDAKVLETRQAQDTKSRALNDKLEDRRVIFLNTAAPILEQLMREAGAAVVLERRSVFISSNAVDITMIAIDRLNVVLKVDSIPDAED